MERKKEGLFLFGPAVLFSLPMALPSITNWDDLPLMLTVYDLIRLFGISRDTAFRLLHEPGFPALRIGKQFRIPKDDLRQWLNNQITPPPQ